MRVTDEMVEAGAKGFWEMVRRGAKWEDVSPSIREDWLMSSRAVLTAALSHAAGQEVEPMARVVHSETEMTQVTLLPIAFTLGLGTHNLYAHTAVARSEGEG